MAMLNAIVALCLFGGAFAEVSSVNTCPIVETMPDFDISKFAGRWYEAEKLLKISEVGSSCVPAEHSLNEDGTLNMIRPYQDAAGIRWSVKAIARIQNATEPGKLKIRYPVLSFAFDFDYLILGTDYENYAVIYDCSSTTIGTARRAWIATRERTPSKAVMNEAFAIANRNQLSQSDFATTNHTGCEEL